MKAYAAAAATYRPLQQIACYCWLTGKVPSLSRALSSVTVRWNLILQILRNSFRWTNKT